MTALGTAGARLLVVLDRITGPGPWPAVASPPAPARPPARVAGPSARTAARGARPSGTGRPVPDAVDLRSVTLSYGVGAEPVLDALDLRVAAG
ncbi:ABC transporter ATP-binding protein, partial [Streptomyces sp. TRM76130]|nr:ABC transporter ATP-binding protein [Streptomyces sp. TRM76130]